MGVVLSLDESAEVAVAAKVAMGWPLFLFITPPGWILLMKMWSWGSREVPQSKPAQSNTITTTGLASATSSVTASSSGSTVLVPGQPSARVQTPGPTPTSSVGGSQGAHPSSVQHNGRGSDYGPPNRSRPGATFGSIMDQAARRELAARYGWICQLCLEKIPDVGWDYESPNPRRLSIDHIVPISHGGSDAIGNLQPVHAACNTSKGGRNISNGEYRRQKELLQQKSQQKSVGFQNQSSKFEKYREPRLGDWRNANTIVRQLSDEIQRSNLSAEQRSRALQFLQANHPRDLQKKCQRGHAFTLENTYFRIREDGLIGRECRVCKRDAK